MDGVHDMGGMHGFGPVEAEVDEPVFHQPWEGRTVGLMLVTAAKGLRTSSLRPWIEEMDPASYLASSYYERWARAIEAGLVAEGTVTTEEIDAAAARAGAGPARSEGADPDLVAAISGFLNGPRERSGEEAPTRYAVGDRVTVRRMAPPGHHRCPRYVRGATGTVTGIPGGWPHASSDGPPEATYTVRFAVEDLWGADAERGWLYIDLWERYLA